ncbi:uncharacterized protein [Amphiura filiformis]|uniref:uncharacterized protein isoform X2 n=1 Tax=Amphiura filiformis TaxID=82378 RepID=UPI003B22279E
MEASYTALHYCREFLASEVKGPTVPVERSQLTTLIENSEAARIRLYKNIENCNSERLLQPVIYMGDFLKPGRGEDTTLLQVCSGKLEHINLKQVAKLESKLFSLQKQLHSLHQSLSTVWSHDYQLANLNNQHLTLPINQRLSGQLAKCGKLLQECCQDLLVLSILTPAAPWPVLQRSMNPDINVDAVISSLPSFPRSKQQQVKSSVSALLKACNYSRQVAKLETKAYSEELKFHQAVYHLQIKYMESLFNAVREAYSTFESSVQSLICQPMQEILQEFSKLQTSASEEALKDFLKAFKTHTEQLESTVESLSVSPGGEPSQGEEALSQFGHDFLTSIHHAAIQCAKERDELAQDIKEVKEMQEQHAKEELAIFKPSPEKEPSVYPPIEKESPTNDPPTEDGSLQVKESRKSDSAKANGEKCIQPGAATKKKITKTSSTPTSGFQNGGQRKALIDKKKGLSLKSPIGLRQPAKTRPESDRGKPPTPTSRGIPTPTPRSRASSRTTPSPSVMNRSSSLSGMASKGGGGKSVAQSGSGIPKISPRSGIPRAFSTPSKLSQGGDISSKKTEH